MRSLRLRIGFEKPYDLLYLSKSMSEMYNITVVSTIHSERGKCNSDGLYRIIESTRPEVIFEELTQDLFDMFYNDNQFPQEPLEVKAIKRYLLDHNLKHFPVDINPSQDLSVNEIEFMFNTFKKYQAYKKLDDEQNTMTERDGFSFLNSNKYSELIEQKKIMEGNLMEFMINKNMLLRIHKLFYEEQNHREHEIIKNIYNCSKTNQYNQALLFIGSGHRKSIFEKIGMYKSQDNVKLFWTLYEN